MFRDTLNILCVFTQCGFVSPWLCVGEKDVAVTREAEREEWSASSLSPQYHFIQPLPLALFLF